MAIILTESDQQNIELQVTEATQLKAAYSEEREFVWQQTRQAAQENNKNLCNGKVYTSDELLQTNDTNISVKLGRCEHKDVSFSELKLCYS